VLPYDKLRVLNGASGDCFDEDCYDFSLTAKHCATLLS
jgi:hypothetical protein